MAFVNFSLLLGSACVAIPIVLHLIMRQKPRPVVFPALRFIQQRRIANQRRLRLRHWLLLALRCGAIGLVALALARPSVASAALSNWAVLGLVLVAMLVAGSLTLAAAARKSSKYLTGALGTVAGLLAIVLVVAGVRALLFRSPILGDQEAPVAAVLIVDTAPRMQFRQDNETRLEAARDMALWLIRQLPADSQVAILDSRAGGGAFAVDRSAASKTVERLRPVGTPRRLPELIATGIGLVQRNSRPRKEIYVLTDLTRGAWQAEGSELARQLAEQDEILLYVIDVGAERPRNFALGDLQLSSELVPRGSELAVEVDARASGAAGERTVVLELEQQDPTLPIIRDGQSVLPKTIRRGSQDVKLSADASERVRFVLRGLEPGVHQGLVRLVGQDGLALDDVRHFAVEVQEAWPVLVVAPAGVSTTYLTEALAPRVLRETDQASFHCDVIDQSRLATQELADYRAVALLDPQPLTPDVWTRLADFAERGGGLAFFLGHNAEPVASFQSPAAIRLLGGQLTRQTRSSGDLFLSPRSYDHPITAAFRANEANVPWDRFPVYYHWNLDELAAEARTIIPYGNNKPALVENRLGRGRVLTLTTPISDPVRPKGYATWNRLATGADAWPCFMLVNEMLLDLVGSGATRLNLYAGEAAVLPNDESVHPPRYQLFTPLEQPQDVLARDGRLTIRFTDNPGAYRLRGQKNGPIVRGFAVNLSEATTDMARLPREELDGILGKGRYQLARRQEDIDRAVGQERIGSEFYPLLVTLLALGLGLEHLLANRFYKKDE